MAMIRALLPAVAATALWIGGAAADTVRDPVEEVDCDEASVFTGGLFTDICWDCVFPIRIAGSVLGGSSGDAPSGASNEPLCLCHDPVGVPAFSG
jgi:conjugal transfer pilus assembly protein TraU